jgi:hypothetical protein
MTTTTTTERTATMPANRVSHRSAKATAQAEAIATAVDEDLADLYSAAVDAMAEAGMLPADDDELAAPAWARHFEAAARLADGTGWALARFDEGDERLRLDVWGPTGVILVDPLTFALGDLRDLGRRMFVAAVQSITTSN